MIFIVKVGDDYTEEDLMSLHKRLSDELNEGKNNTVMCLPSDCDYDCINEYDLDEQAEEEKFKKLLGTIFNLCELSGFHLEERIVVKNKRTGRIWR